MLGHTSSENSIIIICLWQVTAGDLPLICTPIRSILDRIQKLSNWKHSKIKKNDINIENYNK